MNARNRETIGIIFVAALVAFLLALIPTCGHAATADEDEAFCEMIADYAQVAANARDQGMLLGEFKSIAARKAKTSGSPMGPLIGKIATAVYTSDDFAGLTPEQTMRYAYRTCKFATKN